MAGNGAVVVRKNLIYKRAQYLQSGGNLQADVEKALKIAKTVGARKQVVDPTTNTVVLLNSFRPKWSMIFGSILLYTRGRNQPLVTENDAAVELEVSQLAPPSDESGARSDFIESLLFFGIKGNHCMILQSSGLRARQLEAHFLWLLQDQTSVLDAENRVALADHPSRSAIHKALASPVKNVRIGIPLESSVTQPKTTKMSTSAKTLKFLPSGVGFDLIGKILGNNWLNKMKLKGTLDEARLKVEVRVSYSRETTQTGQELLNEIAVNLRHRDPDDVHIDLKNGGTLTGDELKVTGPISVNTYGGLVEPADLFKQMHDWLITQIQAGVIEA